MSSNCPTFSPTTDNIIIFNFRHSSDYAVISSWEKNLCFLNDQWFEHLFSYLFAIHIFVECLFNYFCLYEKFGLLIFLALSCKYSLFSLDSKPFSDICLQIFSQFLDCYFTIITVSSEEQVFQIFMKSKLLIFAFIVHNFCVLFKKLSIQWSLIFSPLFSFGNFRF